MNDFGGNWTQEKIEIFMKYLPAYLQIMNSMILKEQYAKDWKLLYFDGFAGSGEILQGGTAIDFIEGVASRVLSVNQPRTFDFYRFVELDAQNAALLERKIKTGFPEKIDKVKVLNEDFNGVVMKMADAMRKNKNLKCLAFIDPFGMQVDWKSIEALKGLSIDAWILIPTGLGVNRLLKRNGELDEKWSEKLQNFLGIPEAEIKAHFYRVEQTLFGDELKKEENAIEKAHQLYKNRLTDKGIFKFVSAAYVMRNSTNSIMYHFLLASNNQTAIKIGNEIVGSGISQLSKKR